MNAQDIFEGVLVKDPKRVNIFEGIERPADHHSLAGDDKLDILRVLGEEKIADDPDQDKGNGHEWAIGKEGVGDHHKEEEGGNNNRSRIGPHMNMLGSYPGEEDAL